LLALGFATGCAVRYPVVLPMREQQFRSHDQAVVLPLDQQARGEVASFLEHGGNRFGRNPVPDPQAARYAWQANPAATLFNGAGLPAVPFRTDHWPGVTDNHKPW
jgi:hypothetical protein